MLFSIRARSIGRTRPYISGSTGTVHLDWSNPDPLDHDLVNPAIEPGSTSSNRSTGREIARYHEISTSPQNRAETIQFRTSCPTCSTWIQIRESRCRNSVANTSCTVSAQWLTVSLTSTISLKSIMICRDSLAQAQKSSSDMV